MSLELFSSAIGAQDMRPRRRVFLARTVASDNPWLLFEMLEPRLLLATDLPAAHDLIPDLNLQTILRQALNKPTGPITDTELGSLTSLDASESNIKNLTGLEYATNLHWLDLSANDIADISPLAKLTGLRSLHLSFNPLDDLHALPNLTALQELSLSGIGLDDIGFLSSLTNIQHLDIKDNYIENIAPLAGLVNLTTLDLDSNLVADIRPIAGLANLTELHLFDNDVQNVTPLTGLTKLDHLGLAWNNIANPSSLAGLTNLVYLDISHCAISDIAFVSSLTNLDELGLYSNAVSDIRPLATLASLQHLHLGSNRISDISPLATLTNLQDIDLFSNQITDINPLARLTKLTELYFDSNWISDIASLATLTHLQTLYLGYNLITDIGALSDLTNLSSLDISHNCLDISDGSPAARIIDTLLAANVQVTSDPQNAPLVIAGTPANDIIYVSRDGLEVNVYATADGAGDAIATRDLNTLSTISINPSAGDDIVILDFSKYSPIPAGGLSIDGGSHNTTAGNVLLLLGLHDNPDVSISDNQVTVGSDIISYTNIQAVQLSTGSLGSLTLTGSAAVNVIPGAAAVLKVGSLTVSNDATLDLGDNGMVVSGRQNREAVLNHLTALIRSARGNGDWNGNGITGSAAKFTPFTTLACLINDKMDGTGPLYTTFPELDGIPITTNDIIIKLAWQGDANLDGVVNADDYFLIDYGLITQAKGYYNGDFNYDNSINADDLFMVDSAFIGQNGTASALLDGSLARADTVIRQPPSKSHQDGILADLFCPLPLL